MWGQLAFPRPVGLGLPPRGRRLLDNGSDPSLELVDSWVHAGFVVARPVGLPLAHFGLWFFWDFALPLYNLQGHGFLKYL